MNQKCICFAQIALYNVKMFTVKGMSEKNVSLLELFWLKHNNIHGTIKGYLYNGFGPLLNSESIHV